MNELIQRLNSSDEAESIYAVYDITEIEDADRYIPAFLERLKCEQLQAVRNAITDSLKALDTTSHFGSIFELFSSDDAYLTLLSPIAEGVRTKSL